MPTTFFLTPFRWCVRSRSVVKNVHHGHHQMHYHVLFDMLVRVSSHGGWICDNNCLIIFVLFSLPCDCKMQVYPLCLWLFLFDPWSFCCCFFILESVIEVLVCFNFIIQLKLIKNLCLILAFILLIFFLFFILIIFSILRF